MKQPNAEDCAFPRTSDNWEVPGLTKREYFAALAMQGMASNPETFSTCLRLDESDPKGKFAELAVEHADALIEALNKGKA